MKKVISLAAGAVLVAAAVSAFVCVNNEKNDSKVFFRINVEVLADSEEGKGEVCYRKFKEDPCEQEIYCGTCQNLPGRASDKSVCYRF